MTKTTPAAVSIVLLLGLACGSQAQIDPKSTPKAERLTVKVLAEYPHDSGAFTQGLLWHDGALYESTGLAGSSTLRRVEPTTGIVEQQYNLDDTLFGEGLALVDGRLVQLTWHAGLALVYDAAGFFQVDQLTYRGDGWGLAWDGRRLVMSNGTPRLAFRDPKTFEELGSVQVTLNGAPLGNLNELEYADGQVYANVWQEDRIVRIDPQTGKVRAVIDAERLVSPMERRGVGVLNGIAYDPASETFWLTGKNWPWMFQVVFVPDPDGRPLHAPR